MDIELTGILKWVFIICVGLTSVSIIVMGTLFIINWVIIELLAKNLFKLFKVYPLLVKFIWHRKAFKEWEKKNSENEKDK